MSRFQLRDHMDQQSLEHLQAKRLFVTVMILSIWALEKYAVITVKVEQYGFTIQKCVPKVQLE